MAGSSARLVTNDTTLGPASRMMESTRVWLKTSASGARDCEWDAVVLKGPSAALTPLTCGRTGGLVGHAHDNQLSRQRVAALARDGG
jgi:hypothetical protein